GGQAVAAGRVAGNVHGRKISLPRQTNMTCSVHFRKILVIFLCYDGPRLGRRATCGRLAWSGHPLRVMAAASLHGRGSSGAMRYLFGDYVLDTQRTELHGAGGAIKLRRKVFQVLAYLLAHRERVVPKQELLEHLWPDQFVGDEVLKACITALRK